MVATISKENQEMAEKYNIKSESVKYGCELIYHKANEMQVYDKSIPNDTFIVTYKEGDEVCRDMCRGRKQVDIFDLYYDIYGKDLISINYGHGLINPRTWGYKTPSEKKKKRRS